MSQRSLFVTAAGATVLAVSVGFALIFLNGIPGRFSPAIQAMIPQRVAHRSYMSCPGAARVLDRTTEACRLGPPAAPVSFFIWGDSHAAGLAPAFQKAAMRIGRGGMLVSNSGCAPLLGVWPADEPQCRAFVDSQLKAVLSPGIHDVVLVAVWGRNAESVSSGREVSKRVMLIDDRTYKSGANNHQVFAAGLERTIKTLHDAGKRVIFVQSEPEMGVSVPEAMAKIQLLGSDFKFAPTVDTYLKRQAFVMQTVERMRTRYGVVVVYPHRILCPGLICRFEVGGHPFYLDENHLNAMGADLLVNLLASSLASPAAGIKLPTD